MLLKAILAIGIIFLYANLFYFLINLSYDFLFLYSEELIKKEKERLKKIRENESDIPHTYYLNQDGRECPENDDNENLIPPHRYSIL